MGMEVQLIESKGSSFPALELIKKRLNDLERLLVPDVEERLGYVFEALRLTKKHLDGRVPLIGFAGAPWTLLCYMVQGQGSKTFDGLAKAFCYTQPHTAHRLLQMINIGYDDRRLFKGTGAVQYETSCADFLDSWARLVEPGRF